MEEIDNKFGISILLVSDTHKYDRNMIILREKLLRENKKYDLVFHTGDFDSISTYDWEHFNELSHDEQEKSNKIVLKAMDYFADFSKSGVVYFITGNHDSPIYNNPITFCDDADKNKLSFYNNAKYYNIKDKYFCLLNNSILRISTKLLIDGVSSRDYPNTLSNKDYDLELIGVGGSVPTLVRPCKFYKYSESDLGSHIYDGVPYSNDSTFEEDYIKDVDCILNHRENLQRQYILLTHSGGESLTSNHFEKQKGKIIDMGSTALTYRLFLEDSLVFTCHGHSHDAQGRNELSNGKLMVNCGSLLEKYYAEIYLDRNYLEKWDVVTTNFNKLT